MERERRQSPFGLRAKLTVLIESMIVILVLITGMVTTHREKKTLENELHKRGLALAADLATFSARPMLSKDLPMLRRFVNHSMAQDYVRYVMLLDSQGRVVMHSDLSEVGKILAANPVADDARTDPSRRRFTQLPVQKETHRDLYVPIEIDGTKLGTVLLGYSYLAVEKEIADARRQIVVIGLMNIVVGGVVAFFLATFISTPIKRLTKATESLADGKSAPCLSVDRTDEIGTLVGAFNKMAVELEKHRDHLQNLVDARTIELETVNQHLEREIEERERAQTKLRRSRQRLRELALHIQSVKEEEAKRIAREIHDELGQALTGLKIDLYWMVPRLSRDQTPLREKIDKMSMLIDTTVHAVRRIASELRPGILDDFGLSAAMDWQAKEFNQRTGLQCRFLSDPDDIVPDPDRSVAIFRIFQEALTNIVRHAHATEVNVLLRETNGELSLTVRDNGKGITEDQLADSRSFGVIGMRERVNHLGGNLFIHGLPGNGTTVSVTIPEGEGHC